jgi:AcrR family transcriptional regulator
VTKPNAPSGRAPLTIPAVVGAARRLLAAGGLENVTIRDVAQQLQVTSPALYKHVNGRAEIVDLLGAACLDELTVQVTAGRDAAEPDDHAGRLLGATRAWSAWASSHPAEHALVFATPAFSFDRPATGQSFQAGLRLGAAFLAILEPAARAGVLREASVVPADVAVQLRQWASSRGLTMTDGQLWTAVRGFQDAMGMIMTESAGQLGFALSRTETYMQRRLEDLVADLIVTPPW